MAEFTPIETQEELDKIISKRLERERSKYADYEELKEKVASMSEVEKELQSTKSALASYETDRMNFEKEITSLKDTLKQKELREMKVNVALKHGLPFEFANRLVGEDLTTLEEDAQSMAAFIKNTKILTPTSDTEKRESQVDSYSNLSSLLKQGE